MPHEQTDVEIEISGILDRLGSEMLAASKRLRVAPYVVIEPFLKEAKKTMERVSIAATLMKAGSNNTAFELLRAIEVPEIDFTDVDEDQEPQL